VEMDIVITSIALVLNWGLTAFSAASLPAFKLPQLGQFRCPVAMSPAEG